MGIRHVGEKRYVYRSVRVGSKVTSTYLGAGDEACLMLEVLKQLTRECPMPADPAKYEGWHRRRVDHMRREFLERKRRKFRARFLRIRSRIEAVEGVIKGLVAEVRDLTSGAMIAAGYHQHKRTWRRKRGGTMAADSGKARKVAGMASGPADNPGTGQAREPTEAPLTPSDIARFLDRAEKDARDNPGAKGGVLAALKKRFGADPADEVLSILLKKVTGSDVGQELARREHARVLAELLGPSPTPIERLLAERAAICWLDVYTADRLALSLDASLNFSPAEKDYFQKTRDRAHRRFVQTLQALNAVRAKALPALKLSVAVRGENGMAAAVATVETPDSAPQIVSRDGSDPQVPQVPPSLPLGASTPNTCRPKRTSPCPTKPCSDHQAPPQRPIEPILQRTQ